MQIAAILASWIIGPVILPEIVRSFNTSKYPGSSLNNSHEGELNQTSIVFKAIDRGLGGSKILG